MSDIIKRESVFKGFKEAAPLYGRYGTYANSSLLCINNIFPLIAENQVIEIYKNAFIASENLLFKGSFGAFKMIKDEAIIKYLNKPILQFIAAKGSLIIMLRKGAI